ncbi:L,D-transpeptidase [Shinella kummerowiae]|uniref:L,D-transpeptidase n=1 Tax=Shinella kummerowiae TaxID=417745 RepID=UPI0021B6CAF6|nr:L,D-transpeptidase [Shinella kummerowiae]MCT7663135.1 L,D-transpeptidase [Shinella kummerowiae]
MRKYASILLATAFAATAVMPLTSANAFPAAVQGSNVETTSNVTLVQQYQSKKQVAAKYKRTKVRFVTDQAPGTVIVDTNNKYLYYVEGNNKATRYGIGVGRDGFGWSGVVKVGRKAEWPSWTPPAEMRQREAKKGRILPVVQPGGEDNPLGARALYLFKGGRDTIFRIHGTNQPWTIGQNMSSGCIRMMNKDVEHLYARADVGTKVVVVGPGNRQGAVDYNDRGVDFFGNLFGFGG